MSLFTLVTIVFTKRIRRLATVVTGAIRVVRFTLGSMTDRHFAFSVTVASNITFDHFKTSSFAALTIDFVEPHSLQPSAEPIKKSFLPLDRVECMTPRCFKQAPYAFYRTVPSFQAT